MPHLHTVDCAGFVLLDSEVMRDQICATYGPEVNCVMQVDFHKWFVIHRVPSTPFIREGQGVLSVTTSDRSGDKTPRRMTGVTLHSTVPN